MDEDHTRDYDMGEQQFHVWDIEHGAMVSEFDQLKRVVWPEWSLSGAINARYLGQTISVENQDEEKALRK